MSNNKDYIKLFVKREGKVVFGRRLSNLWLLSSVLILTFLAVAFSNASLRYLSYKMEDPFINWLNIENVSDASDYAGLAYALEDQMVRDTFNIVGYQEDYKFSYNFFNRNDEMQYLTGRFFQSLNTPLIDAILEDENVINNQKVQDIAQLDSRSIGIIMTYETLRALGYQDAPAYVDYARYSPGADSYGFRLFSGDEYAKVPIPVLGVVEKLPGNVDFITSAFFLEQDFNDYTYPFYMTNGAYASSLHFFVPEDVDKLKFIDEVLSISSSQGLELTPDDYSFYLPQIQPYKAGSYVSFLSDYGTDCFVIQNIAYAVEDKFAHLDVKRVYEFDFSDSSISQISFLSVHFSTLDNIKDFEIYAKKNFNIDVEMSQVNAKSNFNAVSVLANILSWAIVAFSLICIILYIVNLLQSYFQKVKRNIGTFKAFGIANSELIRVYVMIILVLTVAAILVSLAVVYIVQLGLPLFGLVKDQGWGYLYLWNGMTFITMGVVVLISTVTVYIVMKKLLAATPGDLIYDR